MHLIKETVRHNGRIGILREMADGARTMNGVDRTHPGKRLPPQGWQPFRGGRCQGR